jgi:hypothetical protein
LLFIIEHEAVEIGFELFKSPGKSGLLTFKALLNTALLALNLVVKPLLLLLKSLGDASVLGFDTFAHPLLSTIVIHNYIIPVDTII